MSKETSANNTSTAGETGDGDAAAQIAATNEAAANANAATADANASAAAAAEKSYTRAELDKVVAKAIKDAEKKTADAEAKAKLSEEERAKAETSELRGQLRERDARDAVKDEAGRLGVKNANALYRIVKDDLEFDDKGNISNLKDVLETAKTDFPELFDAKPRQGIDAGTGGGAAPATNSFDNQIRKALGY